MQWPCEDACTQKQRHHSTDCATAPSSEHGTEYAAASMNKRKEDNTAASTHKRQKVGRAVDLSDGKRFQLWGNGYSKEERTAMQLDDTAVFSVTDARTADRITKHMLTLAGGPFEKVADGCACVGGNSLSFGRALTKTGGKVLAIEIDETRFRMLENNVRVARLEKTVTCVLGDFAQLVLEEDDANDASLQARAVLRESELLFLDPPWGGREVDDMPNDSVELEMSGRSLPDLIHRISQADFATQHVLLKLPPSYKLHKLQRVRTFSFLSYACMPTEYSASGSRRCRVRHSGARLPEDGARGRLVQHGKDP